MGTDSVFARRQTSGMMIALKVSFLMVVAMVVSTYAGDGPRCVDQQENCAHFVEKQPTWCNALLAEICPKSCGQCEGECKDAGDWCMDRKADGWCESAAGYMNRYCKKLASSASKITSASPPFLRRLPKLQSLGFGLFFFVFFLILF